MATKAKRTVRRRGDEPGVRLMAGNAAPARRNVGAQAQASACGNTLAREPVPGLRRRLDAPLRGIRRHHRHGAAYRCKPAGATFQGAGAAAT
jgi:hypothetical protein